MTKNFDFSLLQEQLQEQSRGRQGKIRLGVSSCLLGERVRYDGGHKHHPFISDTLGQYLEFRRFCPEMEIGLGVPRKPIQLCRNSSAHIRSAQVRCVQVEDSKQDYTEQLRDIIDQQRHWLAGLGGYIFKKGSPSCGTAQVKVWTDGKFKREGVGISASRLMEIFPHLPLEDEEGLEDPQRCEEFLKRVVAYWRARS